VLGSGIVTQTGRLAEHKCQNLIAACLGTGYGRCSAEVFMKSIFGLVAEQLDMIDTVTFVTTNNELATTIATGLGNTEL